jgi:hypothetical protein
VRHAAGILGKFQICLLVGAVACPDLAAAQVSGAPIQKGFVVFIHADPKKSSEKISDIAIALSSKGYFVREPDEREGKTYSPGVDYFSPSAFGAARDVADTVNSVLAPKGSKGGAGPPPLEPRFQGFSGTSLPNYLRVWLPRPSGP